MTFPITHSGPDRAYALCRCSNCGTERLCTPEFDFYARTATGLLWCETCELARDGAVAVPCTDPKGHLMTPEKICPKCGFNWGELKPRPKEGR